MVELKRIAAPGGVNLKNYTFYDRYLIFAFLGLIAIGLLMVASASMVVSSRQFGHPFYFLLRQITYLALGLSLAFAVLRIPIAFWRKSSGLLLLAALFLLILVLLPGLGRQINGSTRWLGLGLFGIQVSEVAKLFVIIYLAGYFVRQNQELRTKAMGFVKPMAVIGLVMGLLLLEPDFGASAVILVTALGMMFLAGVRMRYFLVLVVGAGALLSVLAFSSPYRLQRLTAFLDPWQNPFGSGYQLTQSLIAFGQGGWFGVGLGDSVQKLFYLPEAYADFLFAVLAEELGLMGILGVMLLFVMLISRIFYIGYQCCLQRQFFAGYLAYGFGLWLAMQAMINMGVNAGVLPTKGLTLPLISYGGSSLLVDCVAIAILLRVDYERRRGMNE